MKSSALLTLVVLLKPSRVLSVETQQESVVSELRVVP